jgi:uncharacterized DUF497 family protein
VKYFSWSPEKNRLLQETRGISFEEIVFHIERGDAYIVPFVEDDREVFLKTIIPSRKATRDYLGGG